jgi:hypothetical protein
MLTRLGAVEAHDRRVLDDRELADGLGSGPVGPAQPEAEGCAGCPGRRGRARVDLRPTAQCPSFASAGWPSAGRPLGRGRSGVRGEGAQVAGHDPELRWQRAPRGGGRRFVGARPSRVRGGYPGPSPRSGQRLVAACSPKRGPSSPAASGGPRIQAAAISSAALHHPQADRNARLHHVVARAR